MSLAKRAFLRSHLAASVLIGGSTLGAAAAAFADPPLPTTRADFFEPGTQPGTLTEPLVSAFACSRCHADYAPDQAPFNRWAASMMAQASRDPIFRAAVTIAEQDVTNSGESCWRCHAPMGWLSGHLTNTNGSTLSGDDLQGIACNVCHRMVDPKFTAGESPAEDEVIINGIVPAPLQDSHNGSFVLDPMDRRRGPFDLNTDWAATSWGGWPNFHAYLQSPYHESSRLCANCHDSSAAHLTRQPNGSYAVNAYDTPGPAKSEQFPQQRTYSEWSKSLFGQGPVNLHGRFGGEPSGEVSSCQECHQPIVEGQGCALDPPIRDDIPQHNFNGANSWVIRAVRSIYFDSDTGLSGDAVDQSEARNQRMLRDASDLVVTRSGNNLNVRIINFSGHKLPTGFAEGRRMWIEVVFENSNGVVLAHHGAYDSLASTLDEASTKVYKAELGIDPAMAALTGQTAGPSFHVALNNRIISDNRIPPMGYTLAEFDSVNAAPVPADLYADGQFWDDTRFNIPPGAARVTVAVYHQTTTREFIEALRDQNTTDGSGQAAYDLWDLFGRSQPVEMDRVMLSVACPCDWNGNGLLSVQDIFDFLASWFNNNGDFNGDTHNSVQDLFDYLACYFGGC